MGRGDINEEIAGQRQAQDAHDPRQGPPRAARIAAQQEETQRQDDHEPIAGGHGVVDHGLGHQPVASGVGQPRQHGVAFWPPTRSLAVATENLKTITTASAGAAPAANTAK